MTAAFVLSLDFELHWGLRDHTSVAAYRENLLGVREAIPALLALFERRSIACTWATVGMLMAETKDELLASLPTRLPVYRNRRMSPYDALDEIGADEHADPFHFAPSLVRKIVATPRQELATHTFSHFYALEPGQTLEDFSADLAAAQKMAARYGVTHESIVFPRNQFEPAYLDVLRRHGIRAYRSNGVHWAYVARAGETRLRRAFRLADAYAPLSGPRANAWPRADAGLVDVQASAFLRPYSPKLRRLDAMRRSRLASGIRRAARERTMFHLWWHPHNFGRHVQENLAFLESLLDVFDEERARGRIESLTMADVAARASA